MRRTPALIVGGGPAGATAAILLARAGLPHLLIERTRETGDALCGGFLSWRSLETLAKLGVEADSLNPALVTRVRIFAGDRFAEAELPHPAIGVSRRRLDSLLIARALAEGAAIETGVTAKAFEDGAVRTGDGASISADALFLATGKHELRGLARPAFKATDPALGLRIRIGPAPRLAQAIGEMIELHLFDRGYAGIVLQEDGTANVCMAVHRSRLDEAGDPEKLLEALARESPRLSERLAYRASGTPIDAVANVPYGWRARAGIAGHFRLGDQAAVIPSLAGEGMGIAIGSAARAVKAYRNGGPMAGPRFQRDLCLELARPMSVAGGIRSAAEAPNVAPGGVALLHYLPFLIDGLARLTRIGESPVDDSPPNHDI
ncbi:hypothetical protein BH09PSE4_BH09PSE4_10590 [soil metagenome]